jgi:hypothetical protein
MKVEKGFRPQVASMKLDGPHTVRDLSGYLEDNLGRETLDWVSQGGATFVAVGEGKTQLQELEQLGWQLGKPVDKEVGFHQVRHAQSPTQEAGLLIWRVNGEDRTTHIQSLLKLAGANEQQITTLGQTRRYCDDYLRKFRSLGNPPALVVYGMAKTAAMAMLSQHPISNAKELWDLLSRKGPPPVGKSLTDSDLAKVQMELATLADGRQVWFIPPLYGDLSKDLLDALLEFGVKKFNFIGTAGGVDPQLEVGQVLSPSKWLDDQQRMHSLDWLVPTQGAQMGGTYQRVSTPNLETLAWARDRHQQDIDLVEVELGYWLEATRHRPDVELRVQTVLSDVVQGPNHQDMTEWTTWDNLKLRGPILTSLREALGEDLRISSLQSTSLV